MRIGIMLRTFDEDGGIAVYSRGITRALLEIDRSNDYVLFYRSAIHSGSFKEFDNVDEVVLEGASKILWDQMAVPMACRRHRVDILFHPKFTVPFFAPCKSVMVVHGADWFDSQYAHFYRWLDVQYIRAVMPLYFKRSRKVISVSRLTTDQFRSLMKVPPEKIETIYFAPAKHFRRVEDEDQLLEVRTRYRLPEHFILTLTKRGGDERKNLRGLLQAYELYHRQSNRPIKLVIGGKDCQLFRDEYKIPDEGYGGDVVFPGFIDQADLPSVYSQADLFLYPSNLEAFPIPITEAMACGTPIITSNVNGLEEIAADAASYVDPTEPSNIAETIERVLGDRQLRESLTRKGLARSTEFDWRRCARATLAVLEEAARPQS